MSDQLNQIYVIADGGPFTLAIDNGDRDIIIENITDDLVNAGILLPVEPTDRICMEHNSTALFGDEYCIWRDNNWGDCEFVDLVRIDKDEEE